MKWIKINSETDLPNEKWYGVARYDINCYESGNILMLKSLIKEDCENIEYLDESPDLATPSAEVYRKALEKIIKEYDGIIDFRKEAERKAYERGNDEAADMWRHKREGVEKAKKDITEVLSHTSQPEEVKGEDWISVEKALRFSEWAQWQGYNWNQRKNLWYYFPTDTWIKPEDLFIKFKNEKPSDHPGLDHRGAEQI